MTTTVPLMQSVYDNRGLVARLRPNHGQVALIVSPERLAELNAQYDPSTKITDLVRGEVIQFTGNPSASAAV